MNIDDKYNFVFESAKKFSKPLLLLVLFLGVIILFAVFKNIFSSFNKSSQNIVLWVWERPENLYFMKEEKVTYAYLAGTATKTDNDLFLYFRQQPLRIPDGSITIAAVRVEDKTEKSSFIDSDMEILSDFIVGACLKDRENIGCQIDFDATQSQIEFYKKLIYAVKEKLPDKIDLSITALLSWCTEDRSWFVDLPLDDITPMFFRLGTESNIYWQRVSQGDLVLNPLCQKSIGISNDEELPGKKYLENKTIYIFNNEYWDKTNWSIIKANIKSELDEN